MKGVSVLAMTADGGPVKFRVVDIFPSFEVLEWQVRKEDPAQCLCGTFFSLPEKVTGKKLRKRQTALVFSSVNCNKCDEMLAVVEEFNAEEKYKDQYNLVYIIFGAEEDVKDYSASLNLTGTVVADPTGLLEKMFQVPFKPFMQCFEKGGALKYNAIHMDRSKTYGFLYGLLENK